MALFNGTHRFVDHRPITSVHIDASNPASGIYYDGNWQHNSWQHDWPAAANLHINHKEALSVVLAKRLGHKWQDHTILIYTDSQVAMANINHVIDTDRLDVANTLCSLQFLTESSCQSGEADIHHVDSTSVNKDNSNSVCGQAKETQVHVDDNAYAVEADINQTMEKDVISTSCESATLGELSAPPDWPLNLSPTPILPVLMGFDQMANFLQSCSLPPGWIFQSNSREMNFLYLQSVGELGQQITKFLLNIRRSGVWEARLAQSTVNNTAPFQQLAKVIERPSMVLALVNVVDSCKICIGNPDTKFYEVSASRNGVFTGHEKHAPMVAQQHKIHIIDSKGNVYDSTVRTVDCGIISDEGKDRCNSCCLFRNKLFAMVANDRRKTDTSERIDPSSSTPLTSLTSGELCMRARNIIKAKRRAEAAEGRLRHKLRENIKSEGLILDGDVSDGLQQIMEEYGNAVEEETAKDTFRSLFWQQQKSALQCDDKRGPQVAPNVY
ncbi:uncharacterized protein LOC144348231 [Saccoglossus kowalevskii]